MGSALHLTSPKRLGPPELRLSPLGLCRDEIRKRRIRISWWTNLIDRGTSAMGAMTDFLLRALRRKLWLLRISTRRANSIEGPPPANSLVGGGHATHVIGLLRTILSRLLTPFVGKPR